MATTPRQRNPRPLRIFGTQTDRDDDVPVSLSATAYSIPLYGPKRLGEAALQLIWTAGVTGAFTVQYTLKPNPELTTDTDWVTDTGVTVVGTSLTVAGAAGNACIFLGNILPEWVRIKYTHTSGGPSTVLGYARVDGDR